MQTVFRNHTVICGWNRRGKAVVNALRALRRNALIVIHEEIDPVVNDVGIVPNLFVVSGDPTDPAVLESADIPTAQSVLVLAPEGIDSADAVSMKVALAVEKMQTSVYTVVELREIQNKAYFSWTKVDDLITDQEIAVRLLAQGIRHSCEGTYLGQDEHSDESLLAVYQQLVDPHKSRAQLFRVDAPWQDFQHLTFSKILSTGIAFGVLPVALVGYRKHEILSRVQQSRNWFSWKTETRSNPPGGVRLGELWPLWPGDDFALGIIAICAKSELGENLVQHLVSGSGVSVPG